MKLYFLSRADSSHKWVDYRKQETEKKQGQHLGFPMSVLDSVLGIMDAICGDSGFCYILLKNIEAYLSGFFGLFYKAIKLARFQLQALPFRN